MRKTLLLLALLGFVLFGARNGSAADITLPPQAQLKFPPLNIVDPTLVRINGTQALTARLLPAIVAQQQRKPGNVTVNGPVSLSNGEFIVHGYGASWSVYLSDISLRTTIAANSLSSAFKAAPANRAKIDTTYQFNDATLRFTLTVTTNPKSPITDILDVALSTVIKRDTSIRESFYVTVTGFSGAIDLTLRKNGNFVEVESVDNFTVQVGNVSVSDSARILELANKIASIAQLFNVQGATSVNGAATQLANKLLRYDLGVNDDLKNALNAALKSAAEMGFATQTLPLPGQRQLTVAGNLDTLQSSGAPIPGQAITQLSINAQGAPTGAVPNLPYTYLARPQQDISALTPQGHVEVFIPYSLLDKTMYEVVQMGSLGNIPVPQVSVPPLTVGFKMNVEPIEVPRVNAVPNQPGFFSVDFGARIVDAQVGTVQTGAPSFQNSRYPVSTQGPVGGVKIPASLPVMLTNASARVSMLYTLAATTSGRLNLRYMGVTISQLTGSLSASTASVPLSQISVQLQNALNAQLQALSPIMLVAQAVRVLPGVYVQLQQPRVGARFIGVPLNLVAN